MITRQRGAILVVSLWILAILSILALGIGLRISIQARLCQYHMDRMRALYLARAGVHKAEELLSKKGASFPAPDSLRQCGFVLGDETDPNNTTEAIFQGVKLGEGAFTVGSAGAPGISDEERRLNINTADKVSLTILLNNLTGQAQVESAKTTNEDTAAAIVAWRTADENTTEDDYYKSLPHPYERKKSEFTSTEELLLVRGMTPRVYRLIQDYVTVYGDMTNINTVSDKVLLALGLSPVIVDQIVKYRNGPDGLAGTKDDQVFSASNMEMLNGLLSQDPSGLKYSFVTQSQYFRIESWGMVERSKIKKRIVCIVKKEEGKWPILKSYREF
jgi:general secretion pathway protein K